MDFIWQSAIDFVATHFYVSPFWYWVFVGAVAVAISTATSWYFPPLRAIAGAVFVAVIAGLTGYRRGEYDADRHLKDKAPPPATPPPERERWW